MSRHAWTFALVLIILAYALAGFIYFNYSHPEPASKPKPFTKAEAVEISKAFKKHGNITIITNEQNEVYFIRNGKRVWLFRRG